MNKVIVPYDFSEQAEAAFRMALDIVHQSHGEVHLLHAIELPLMHDTVLMPVLSFEEALLNELRENAVTEFARLKDAYAKGNTRVMTAIEFGPVATCINDYIHREAADLVVMGTKGASGVKELLVGSTTEKIVRTAPCPVLAVKKYIDLHDIRDIVFPNAMEEDQEDLLMHVKALQDFFKAKVHLLWVNTPAHPTADHQTLQRLELFARRFMLKDYEIHAYIDTSEESGVINFTHSIGANLIAMGTHGRKGLAHIISGSVTEDVVNHVDCAVWTYTLRHGRH